MRRRVYVAGAGAITPLGPTWTESLGPLAAGETAVAEVDRFDAGGFPSRVAAAIPGGWVESTASDRRWALLSRAAAEALERVSLDVDPKRVGVFIGAESGRATPGAILALAAAAGGGPRFDHERFGREAAALAGDIDASAVSPAAVTSRLAGQIGARGPAHTVSIACASGAIAIADGARAVSAGVCDLAVCGGVGADVDPLMLAGFGKLGALSARGVSRPFDVRRDGFVVGEGAAVVVLSASGPGLGVEILGCGRSLDAHHLTAPDPAGGGAERAMRAALAEAGDPVIDVVQAHGTSTPLNDEVEAAAIARVAGEVLVSSVKGALGHWVAGAGAIGFLCAVEAVRGTILPTAGLERPDPRCPGRHVIGEARREAARVAMINSFAFGGANASLVVGAAR